MNCIGVVDVEDNNLYMAAVGCDGEAAGLIGEEVAIDLVDGHEDKMCARVVGFFHGVIKMVWHLSWHGWIGRTGLGGLDTLVILVHVPHLQFCVDRDLAACLL